MPAGDTIRNTGAALPIGTVLRQTVLAEQHAVIPCGIVNRARGNNWAGRAAVCLAIEPVLAASAIGLVADSARATGLADGDRTASEAGTSRAAGAETATRLEEDPEVQGDTTDRVRDPAAVAEPPAWAPEALEAAGPDAAEAGGGGNQRASGNSAESNYERNVSESKSG